MLVEMGRGVRCEDYSTYACALRVLVLWSWGAGHGGFACFWMFARPELLDVYE